MYETVAPDLVSNCWQLEADGVHNDEPVCFIVSDSEGKDENCKLKICEPAAVIELVFHTSPMRVFDQPSEQRVDGLDASGDDQQA